MTIKTVYDDVSELNMWLQKMKDNAVFMKWLGSYEPDWRTVYFDRNVINMYHAYLKGIENATMKPLVTKTVVSIPIKRKHGFSNLVKVRSKIKRREYPAVRDIIIDTFKHHRGHVYKTALLNKVSSFFFEGHVNGRFLKQEQEIKESFNKMVKDGEITFKPRKPLILNTKE